MRIGWIQPPPGERAGRGARRFAGSVPPAGGLPGSGAGSFGHKSQSLGAAGLQMMLCAGRGDQRTETQSSTPEILSDAIIPRLCARTDHVRCFRVGPRRDKSPAPLP